VRLEHLPEGSEFCPLLRLYDFSLAEAQQLLAVAELLASGGSLAVPLHLAPFVAADSSCHLTLRVSAADLGIIRVSDTAFVCELSQAGWSDFASLVQPFTVDALDDGFQWLLGGLSTGHRPALLLSPSGRW
jgi:hypothetical protein